MLSNSLPSVTAAQVSLPPALDPAIPELEEQGETPRVAITPALGFGSRYYSENTHSENIYRLDIQGFLENSDFEDVGPHRQTQSSTEPPGLELRGLDTQKPIIFAIPDAPIDFPDEVPGEASDLFDDSPGPEAFVEAFVEALDRSEKPVLFVSGELDSSRRFDSPIWSLEGQVAQTRDLYQFGVETSGVFTATLTGLSGDADVQLIQDKNNNREVDPGEIIAWQWERGSQDESIRQFLDPGDYFVRVVNHRPEAIAAPTEYSLTTQFTAAAQDDLAFSIRLVYQSGLEGLGLPGKDAIRRAADYWESAISHSSFDVPLSLAVGVYGTLNRETPFLAYGGPQAYRSTGDRIVPVTGVSVINTLYLDEYNQNPDYLEAIMRHELGHVLGFGVAWEQQGNNLVDRDQTAYRADTYAGQAYGALLGTDIATAIPLDPASLTHWDEDVFKTELMTPRAEGIGERLPVSQVTLASLRDLGWNVNFGAADSFSLG